MNGLARIGRTIARGWLGLVGVLVAAPMLLAAAPAEAEQAAPAGRNASAAQSQPTSGGRAVGHGGAASRPAASDETGIRWSALQPAQRAALAPLEKDWPAIDAARKEKWLVMAARFESLPPAERQRIQTRMTEWARLSPSERGQARFRFQEANQVPLDDRRQRWLDYQALPPDQKRRLAARAAVPASSPEAAPRKGNGDVRTPRAAREASQTKSNMVPNPALSAQPTSIAPTIMRAGPGATTTSIVSRPLPPAHQQTGMPKIAATPEFIDRSTLLPRRGPQAAAVGAGAAPASAPARR